MRIAAEPASVRLRVAGKSLISPACSCQDEQAATEYPTREHVFAEASNRG
jgi:hypothetical protein